MTSLFRGIVNADGKVRANLSKAGLGSTIRGGIALGANNVVHMSTTSLVESRVMGVPISNDGTVCVETDVGASSVYLPGGLREGDTGRLYCTETDAPEVIHQGVGVRNGGRLCLSLEPLATFIANLHNNVASTVGPGTFTRASEGLYLGADGNWRIAPVNAPGFEDDRLLMEPAITNLCLNYNANPDVALTNYSPTGEAAGTFSRVYDPQLIADSGLSDICTDGYVIEASNPGPSIFYLAVEGDVTPSSQVNVNAFGVSSQGECFVRLGGVGDSPFFPVGGPMVHRFYTGISGAGNRHFFIGVKAGGSCRFALSQLIESPAVMSPIITQGEAAIRAVDELSWASASGFFNQAQGMALMTLVPGYSKTEQAAVLQGLLSLDSASSSNLLFMDGSFKSTDGTNTAAVATPSFTKDDVLRLAVIYGPTGASALQVGYSLNGAAWVWGTAVAYDGGFTLVSALILARAITLPGKYSDVQLFNENKGTTWVEANYS